MAKLREHEHAIERAKIEQALRDANGIVSRAARLLGYKNHHTLGRLLNEPGNSDLASLRRFPFHPRRKPLVRPYTGKGKRDPFTTQKKARVYTGPDRRERGRWERDAL